MKNGAKATGIRTGPSQAVPHKTVDNVFDLTFSVVPSAAGYWLLYPSASNNMGRAFTSLDDLMTFLAQQAIEKMGRAEQ